MHENTDGSSFLRHQFCHQPFGLEELLQNHLPDTKYFKTVTYIKIKIITNLKQLHYIFTQSYLGNDNVASLVVLPVK